MRWPCLIALSVVSLSAQLAPPNAMGISVGHVHLVVNDPDAQKKLFVDVLGAQAKTLGPLELLKVPGILVVLQKARTAPTDGSDGSTVNHFGFLVKSYSDTKAKLTAANIPFAMDNEKTKQIIAIFPEKVRVEFTEDTSLKVPATFHHIHISTPNQEELRAWYVKTFGGVEGKRGNFPAAMFPGGEVDFAKAQQPQAPTKGRSLDHIGFEVKGLEAFCKKLAAEGVTFDTTYRVIPQLDNLQIAYVLDPEGTRIELTEGFMGQSQ
jgi:catechol 2,3-dioxygenase-like lactoylglutathione lyase family enzyme